MLRTFKSKLLLLTGLCWLMCFSAALAQNIAVTGTVTDELGPLTGAVISVKGTTIGTITDLDGNFSISAPSNGTLKISLLGYLSQEISINGQKTIHVKMKEDTQQLEEVVVVGYGAIKKSDVTGAVASVQAKDLKYPSSSVAEMMRGKAAGVQINLASGRPGSGSTMRIRGKRSLADDANVPLYIVDGVEVESINVINPNDISSIDILKDASSQAIYGARAANGVVLITTKRGEKGKPQITFDSYVGTQSLSKNFDYYNADEFYELRWQGKKNYYGYTDDQRTPDIVLADKMMEEMYAKREFTDWENLMFSNAISQKYDISVRGATDKMRIAFMMGYFDQDGMVDKSNYRRANFRLNADYDASKFLSLGSNISFIKGWSQTEDGSFDEFITRPPIAKVYNEDGSYSPEINTEGLENPLYKNQHSDQKSISDRLDANLYLNLKPFAGFNYKLNLGYRTRFTETGVFKDSEYAPEKTFNSGTLTNTYFNKLLLENIFSYEKKIGSEHKLTLTAVQSYEKEETKTMGFGGSQLPVDFFEWNGLPDAIQPSKPTRGITDRTMISFLGRVNYSLYDRYLLTASIRRDGSSVFGENHKWGNFPSVALAWRISEEKFVKPIEWIDNLKFRLSYGAVGNQSPLPPYRTLGLTSGYDMRFDENILIVGYSPTNELNNPNLKWESTTSLNVGLDFGFFDNRITGAIEHFNTTTNDLLVKKTITSTSGYTNMWDNLAESKTRGWELTLGGDVIRKKDFNWNVNATLSTAKSEVVKISGKVDADGKPINDITNGWFIGEPIDITYGFIFDGIWQASDDQDGDGFIDKTIDTDGDGIADKQVMENAKPGNVRVKDIDGNGYITNDDRIPRSLEPDWIGSLSSTITYKGLDLYAELYTVQGLLKNNSYLKGGNLQGKLNAIKVNYWTPENPSNEYPRPNYVNQDPYNGALGWQDGSYVRLRTLTLGYTLPNNVSKKFFVNKLRLYCTATNLWTLTDYLSYSPELSVNGYPEARQIIFGLNVQF